MAADVPYRSNVDRCRFDVFAPPDWETRGTPYPMIVYIHGGGWTLGSRERARSTARRLADRGHVVVNVGYRLSPISVYHVAWILAWLALVLFLTCVDAFVPAAVACLVIATLALLMHAWVRGNDGHARHPQHAEDVALATGVASSRYRHRRLVLAGHSAGAHLASLLACNRRFLDAQRVEEVSACVALCGVFSDARMRDVAAGNALFYGVFDMDDTDTAQPGYAADAFPIYHVTPRTPPHLLWNADHDISLKTHTLDMMATLLSSGVYARALVARNCNHFTICRKWDTDRKYVLDSIEEFVRECTAR